MRAERASRETAAPRREKSRPGPVPTLGQLAAQASWVWVHCEARDCHHRAPVELAGIVARFGSGKTSNLLRERAKCSRCGALRATLRLPSWVDSRTGTAPFPAPEPAGWSHLSRRMSAPRPAALRRPRSRAKVIAETMPWTPTRAAKADISHLCSREHPSGLDEILIRFMW